MLNLEKIKKIQSEDIKKDETKKDEIEYEPSLSFLNIKDKLDQLKDKKFQKENPDKYKELCYKIYKDISSFFIENGGEFASDVNNIYRKYQDSYSDPLVVRREDPEKVAQLVDGKELDLIFDPKVVGDRGDKYANSAIWPYGKDPVAGIRNAFLEGRGMAGPIVTLTAIKANPDNTNIEIPQNAKLNVGNIEREAVRIFSGNVSKEDLKFIILRIQKDFFPEENLSEQEIKTNPKQIFRAIEFEQ
jgi:hypothetical protein